MTSANLSQAAWGVLQQVYESFCLPCDICQSGRCLYIKSYELGVLYLPSDIKKPYRCIPTAHSTETTSFITNREFSCTPNHEVLGVVNNIATAPAKYDFRIGHSSTNIDDAHINFPIPFQVPPPRYKPQDVPWTWDSPQTIPDVHGNVLE